MLALTLALTAALVVEDHAALRAGAEDGAPKQAELFRGDWLEVRGQRAEYFQVYDHRRERPGYVRRSQVRAYVVDDKAAPELAAVIDFLREMSGSESLGIGVVALFLQAAPAGMSAEAQADVYDAMGDMAERLGRRASARHLPAESALVVAHLDVAASYGVRFVGREREGQSRLCYDGAAFRRVLALGGSMEQRARAALALTAPECTDATLAPAEAQALWEAQSEVLGRVDPASLPAQLTGMAGRLRMRRAAVFAALAWAHARRGEAPAAAKASAEAVRELALVDHSVLVDDDARAYGETALRVAAARWPSEPAPTTSHGRGLGLRFDAGRPGETCMTLLDGGKLASPTTARCTWGVVWPQSLRAEPHGTALTVAVQTLPGWVEVWLFRRAAGEAGQAGQAGWTVDTLTPATVEPDLGYVETAGWSPDGKRLLVVREALVGGQVKRDFQLVRTDTLAIDHHAPTVDRLINFRRWAAPEWKGSTLALR